MMNGRHGYYLMRWSHGGLDANNKIIHTLKPANHHNNFYNISYTAATIGWNEIVTKKNSGTVTRSINWKYTNQRLTCDDNRIPVIHITPMSTSLPVMKPYSFILRLARQPYSFIRQLAVYGRAATSSGAIGSFSHRSHDHSDPALRLQATIPTTALVNEGCDSLHRCIGTAMEHACPVAACMPHARATCSPAGHAPADAAAPVSGDPARHAVPQLGRAPCDR
jgi:hypothetical protein